jgi:hypothetical protein
MIHRFYTVNILIHAYLLLSILCGTLRSHETTPQRKNVTIQGQKYSCTIICINHTSIQDEYVSTY